MGNLSHESLSVIHVLHDAKVENGSIKQFVIEFKFQRRNLIQSSFGVTNNDREKREKVSVIEFKFLYLRKSDSSVNHLTM